MAAQFVDPAVSRKKFDREISSFRAFQSDYRRRGWFLTHAEFPEVFVVLATAKAVPPAIVIGVAFDYSNYDVVPPSVRLAHPFTGDPYKAKELPSALNRSVGQQEIALPGMQAAQKMVIQMPQSLMQARSADDVPFLCIAGVREYHDHPAHSGDAWELHRLSGAGSLVRLLEVIYKYGVEPILGFNVQLVPQVTFNFGPPPQ